MSKEKDVKDIVSVTGDVLANLSIEELEERLEMQILAVPHEELLGCACKGGCYCFDGGCGPKPTVE